MKQNKFFDKILENLSKIDEYNLKSIVEIIENERRTFRQILDTLDEGIIGAQNNLIIFWNNRAQELLRFQNIKPPMEVDKLLQHVQSKELYQFILSLPRGSTRVEWSPSQPHNMHFEIEKIETPESLCLLKIVDISDKKRMEIQLKNMESVSALNTLAAGIAHEIKNPMTAIDLHTQVIKKGIEKGMLEVPEEVISYINIIDSETHRLNNILNDFLLTARKRELKLSFEDIREFLQSIIELMTPVMREKKVEIITDLHSTPKIFIDKDYLKQAIINLLKNAVEAMEDCTVKKITIKSFYDVSNDSAGISITDTGPGIEEERLGRIFEPYYTTREHGTGLGLTIVYKIIKEHGGDIRVFTRALKESSSENPSGTTFSVFLPVSKGQKMIESR